MNYLKLLSKRQMQVYSGIMSAKKRKGWQKLEPIDAMHDLMNDILIRAKKENKENE